MNRRYGIKDLDALQDWMCTAIRTPLEDLAKVRPEPVHYLTHGKDISAAERLEIYADDYWSRCLRCLAEDFPGLEHAWGHKKFHTIAQAYLTRHSSHSYTLRDLGGRLEEFLQAEYREKDKAFALDTVRFGWAKIEAFDKPEAPAFDPKQLDKAAQSALDTMVLEFQPHLSLLELQYPVHAWSKTKALTVPKKRRCFLAVYRHQFTVYHRELEKPFFDLLRHMKQGLSLARAVEAILQGASAADVQKLQRHAQEWLGLCVSNGWLCMPKSKRRK